MLTIDALRDYGANVEEGLGRCMNNEAFYLSLVATVIPDTQTADLEAAVAAGDLDRAFEVAHALKGMYANLALTPLLRPVAEITELLRGRTRTDYTGLLSEIRSQKQALEALGA